MPTTKYKKKLPNGIVGYDMDGVPVTRELLNEIIAYLKRIKPLGPNQ